MRLVMTLLARDEADVVDAQVAFHLHAGVDFVVATTTHRATGRRRSSSGTSARAPGLIREPADDMRQDTWVTGWRGSRRPTTAPTG